MYGRRPSADEVGKSPGKKKRPEPTTSVPDRCIDVQQPGRGADPRFPLGPPLMLSPVALPGTVALDGILGPVPSIVPSGRDETYGGARGPSIGLSTEERSGNPRIGPSSPHRVLIPSRLTGVVGPASRIRWKKRIPKLLRGPLPAPRKLFGIGRELCRATREPSRPLSTFTSTIDR